jgi:hypothetical protein
MPDLADILREANALPLTGESTIAYLTRERYHETARDTFTLQSDAFVLVEKNKLESVLRAVVSRDAKEAFHGLEMGQATAQGLEFATLAAVEPPSRIVISAPPEYVRMGGDVFPGPPIFSGGLGELAPSPPERRNYRLARCRDGSFTLIGPVERMRDEAISEALETMKGLKPRVTDIVEYISRKHNFKVPRKAVRKEIIRINAP